MRAYCAIFRAIGIQGLVATGVPKPWHWRSEFHPTAVSLDVFLPDMLGWTVLNHLKQDPATRHIPVQMLTLDEDRHHGWRGAFAFVTKPTTPKGWKRRWAHQGVRCAAPETIAGGGRQSSRAVEYPRVAGL
jgi:CheY-like chemotaxis protein